MIRLRVLGPIELHDSQGRELARILMQPKRLALLVYLAAANGFLRRDTLLALFWPELDDARARAALNQAIRFLRRELGSRSDSVIVSRGAEELGVDRTRLWCDIAVYREDLKSERFGEALQSYRGDLLEGFHATGADGFGAWVEAERAVLRSEAARAARELAEVQERNRRFTTAVASARRAIELAGDDERAFRELLRLLDRLGDRAGALHAYALFAKKLRDEFSTEPAVETVVLMDAIRKRDRPPINTGVSHPRGALTSEPVVASALSGRVDGWQLERELARGGSAIVYLAIDAKHQRQVAFKTLRPELVGRDSADAFLREIQITAQLAHPHILPLIDSGIQDGMLYYVTPYLPGESLRETLERRGALPLDETVSLSVEIAEALDYAHRHGVVHRDIKPENILLADSHAVIADFGVARALSAAGVGDQDGTPGYMSPEQRAGHATGTQADVYSLGCVMFEMLTNRRPEAEDGLNMRRLPRSLPSGLARLIAACMAESPDRRPARAVDVARQLALARPPRSAWRSSPRLLVAAAAALFVATGVSTFASWAGIRSSGQISVPTTTAIESRMSTDTAAQRLYLTGKHLYEESLPTNDVKRQAQSIPYFEEAIRRDSLFARAYIALAQSRSQVLHLQGVPIPMWFPDIAELIQRAIHIDTSLAEAHAMLAGYYIDMLFDWRRAEDHLRKAIALAPTSADIVMEYTWYLRAKEYPDSALKILYRAKQLHPTNLQIRGQILQTLRGTPDTATWAREISEVLTLYPGYFPGRHHLAHLLILRGQRDSALRVLDSVPQTHGNLWLRALAGDSAPARRQLDKWLRDSQPRSPMRLATLHDALGNRGDALTFLERAYEARDRGFLEYLTDLPFVASLREEPRFQAIRRGVGLAATSDRGAPALRRPSEVPRPLTRDSTALALYRAGRYLLRQSYQDSDAATRRKSVEMLRKAVARDSDFAHAYILLAEATGDSDGLDENGNSFWRYDYIRRAIALDSTIAEAHSLLAGILLQRNYDVRGAAAEHRKAMSLNPNSVDVLWEFSVFLRVVGRPAEALKHLRRAKSLEPENAFVRGGILQTLHGLEDTAQLRHEIDEGMMLLPNFVGVRHHLEHLELKRGRPDSALAILDGLPPTLANLWLYAQAGRPELARRRLDSLEALSSTQRLSPITLAVLMPRWTIGARRRTTFGARMNKASLWVSISAISRS